MNCEIEVNNKESSYFKYRKCSYKAKYTVRYKFSKESESVLIKNVCKRHLNRIKKEDLFIIGIENYER